MRMLPSGLDNFLGSDFREPVKNYLADFFRLGGRYPPIPLREKNAKKELFLAKKPANFSPFYSCLKFSETIKISYSLEKFQLKSI